MMGGNEVLIIMRAVDEASSVIDGVKSQLGNVKSSMEDAARGSGILLGAVGGAIAAAGGFAGLMVKNGIASKSFMHDSEIAFTTFLGSGEKAKAFLDDMLTFAKGTPFAYPDLVESARNMIAFGMDAEDVIPTMTSIGDAVASIGGGREELMTISRAFGDMQVSGRVSLDSINRLSENGIQALQILANGAGVSTDEMRKRISSGAVESEWAIQTLVDGIANGTDGIAGSTVAVGGMMAGLKGTFSGATDSMKGAWRRLGEAFVTDRFYELVVSAMGDITGILNKMPAVVAPVAAAFERGFEIMVEAVKRAVKAFGELDGDQIAAAIFIITGAILVGLVPALYAIATGVWAAMAPLIPFLAVGALLGALAFYIYKNWGTFSSFFSGIFNAVLPLVQNLAEVFRNSFESMISHARPIWEQIKQLFISLQPVFTLVIAALGVLLAVAIAVFNGLIRAIGPAIQMFLAILDVVANVVGAIIKWLMGDMKGAQEAWGRAVESTKDVVIYAWEAIKGFISGVVDAILGILRGMGVDVPASAREAFEGAKTAIMNAFNATKTFISGFVTATISIIRTFAINVLTSISNAFNRVRTVASTVWNAIKSAISGVITGIIAAVVNFGSRVVSTISSAFASAQRTASSVWNSIRSTISGVISSVISTVISFGSRVVSTISNAFNSVLRTATSIWNSIKTFISTTITAIIERVKTFGTNLISTFRTAFETAKTTVSSAIETIKRFISTGVTVMVSRFKQFGTDAVAAVKTAFENIKSSVSTAIETIITTITGFGKRFVEAGKGLITAMGDGIKSAVGSLPKLVSGGLGAVRGLLPGSDAEYGPLSDLTKSGAALFPTFAKGIMKNAGEAAKAAQNGVRGINSEFGQVDTGVSAVFSGGKATATIRHEIRGEVNVKGDNSEEAVQFTANSMRTDPDFLRDLRQEVRKR